MIADVHWAGLLGITDSGRDKIVIYLKVDVGAVCDDGTFEARILPCGARIPTVTSALLCEAFVIEIPDSIWERPGIEPTVVRGSTTSFAPGGYILLEDTTFVRGIELSDPEAPWLTPADTGNITCPSGEGEACFPDFDLDGRPGLTAYTRPGGNFSDTGCGLLGTDPYEAGAAPLSPDATAIIGGAARAEEIYVGFRFKGGGGGEIGDDCASGWGKGGLQSLELRAWSCKVLEGTGDFLGEPAGPDQDCNAGQAAFIDENLPAFTNLAEGAVPPQEVLDFLPPGELYPNATAPSEGPISALVRLGDPGADVSCEQIRNTEFPGPGI